MSEIKDTIALLCKFLKLLYGCNVKNEHFRLAKFNSVEENTVRQFWLLLNRIFEGEEVIKERNEYIVNLVKLHMALLKYDNFQFYSLPPDMTSGSRELLLAFGWLVASHDVLKKATRKKILKSNISREFGCPDFTTMNETHSEMKINVKNLRSASDCILWYTGKLHQNLKTVEELAQEWVCIRNKIHEDTQDICGLPHLSTGDAKLIYMSRDTSTDFGHLKEGSTLIETNNSWLKKENIFWQWMETVIAEIDKEPVKETLTLESKQVLVSFIQVLKKNIDVKIRPSSSSNASTSADCNSGELSEGVETFEGIPRFIIQKDKTGTEMEKLLSVSSEQLDQLVKEYNTSVKETLSFLDSMQEKMNGIVVLNI